MGWTPRILELEPCLSSTVGSSISIVARVILYCPGSHVCEMLHSKQIFRTDISIDREVNKFSVLDGLCCKFGETFWIQKIEQTVTLIHPPHQIDRLLQVVETCSGIGAVGIGFHANHAKTVRYNDNNQKFCDWIASHKQTPIVCGDVNCNQTVAKVFECVQGSHVLTAGVSCQPFSRMGDQKEGQDDRSRSLLGTLRMAYLCQSMIVCLECTPTALESKWVQTVLTDFCNMTMFGCTQKVLRLNNVWPAERNRWWATLSHPSLQIEPIDDLPTLRFSPTVLHLVSKMLNPPDWVEKQVQLRDVESQRFCEQKHGIGKFFLESTKAMPTATHSWGSQLVGCECGCRNLGFKQSRLNEKGLHAVLIPMKSQNVFGVDTLISARHLLPQEVALFNGVSPSFVHPQHQIPIRLELAGIGQLASPLQSGWIFAGILYSLQKQGLIHDVDPPRRVLANMCRDLIEARNQHWDTMTHTRYMKIFENEIQSIDHPVIFQGELTNDNDHEDESFTQVLKAYCPIAESKLGVASETSIGAAEKVVEQPRKGKGGAIPKASQKSSEKEQEKENRHHNFSFAPNGGIPGFEVRTSSKRSQATVSTPKNNDDFFGDNLTVGDAEIERPAKISKIAPIVSDPEKVKSDEREQTAAEHPKTEEPIAPTRLCVWAGKPNEVLQPVSCNPQATVGQLASAEAELQFQSSIMRPTSLVGTSLSLSSNLEHEQVVLLDPCLEDFVKCPKQSSSSKKPDLAPDLMQFGTNRDGLHGMRWTFTLKASTSQENCEPIHQLT